MQQEKFKYFVFISYSRIDSRAAKFLHRNMEKFRIPIKLVEETQRPEGKYLRPVFRDTRDLKNSEYSFTEDIKKALTESRYLLVLCSANSAKSPWVEKEITYFLETHENDYSLIIPVILEGRPQREGESCLPPSLRLEQITCRNLPSMIPDDGEETRFGWEKGLVQALSYLFQVDAQKIRRSIDAEERRRRNMILSIISTALFICICLTVWALYAEYTAKIQRNRAEAAEKDTRKTLAVSDYQEASRLIEIKKDIPSALAQMTGTFQNDYSVAAAQRLYGLLTERSWLVERDPVSPDEWNAVLAMEEERYKTLESSWNITTSSVKTEDPYARQSLWTVSVERKSPAENKTDGETENKTEEEGKGEEKSERVPDAMPEKQSFELLASKIQDLKVSPGQEYLFMYYSLETGDDYLEYRSLKDLKTVIHEVNFPADMLQSMVFSPDGTHLALELESTDVNKESRFLILDTCSLRPVLEIPVERLSFSPSAFSHDGRLFAVYVNSEELQVYDVWNHGLAAEKKRSFGKIFGLAFSRDDRYILFQDENLCKRYEIQKSLKPLNEYTAEGANVLTRSILIPDTEKVLLFSISGNYNLRAASQDFRTHTSTPPKRLKITINGKTLECVSNGLPPAAAVYENGSRIALVTQVEEKPKLLFFRTTLEKIGDSETWVLDACVDLPCFYSIMKISPDQQLLALGDTMEKDGSPQIFLCNLQTRKPVQGIESASWISDLDFSPDSSFLAAAGTHGTQLWKKKGEQWEPADYSAQEELAEFLKKTWSRVRFSSEGLVGMTGNSMYLVFNPVNGQILMKNAVYRSGPKTFCFSADGRRAAFPVSNSSAVVFDVHSGEPITPVLENQLPIMELMFLEKDGRLILCCNSSSGTETSSAYGSVSTGKIEYWDVSTKRRIADLIPVDEKIMFMEACRNGNLMYGTCKKLVLSDIQSIRKAESPEEEAILKRLLSLICLKYGGGQLNSWRAPVFMKNPEKPLEDFCKTLTEEQKKLPQVKIWLDLDRWLTQPFENRSIFPGGKELLKPALEALAEENPELCLAIYPAMPVSLTEWIYSRSNQIAKQDYIFGTDNSKTFSRRTLQREQEWNEKKTTDPLIIYNNPRVRFFADSMSELACRKNPESFEVWQFRGKVMGCLNRPEESRRAKQKALDLID